MDSKKVNCQIANILLNDNNEFTNKYTSFTNGSFDYDSIIEDYFKNKGMRSIKIDNANQSICFCNPKDKVTYYNQNVKKSESYFEEVHIHCNDLYHFDNFVSYLNNGDLSNYIDNVQSIPHFNSIKDGLKNSELIIEPMTNEVSATRSLVNILAERSDETIFRALAIHFCKLVDNPKDIDSNLIHSLNEIYQKNVLDNDDIFFSSDISDKLVNVYSKEDSHNTRVNQIPSNRINLGNDDYNISFNDDQSYNL